MQILRSESDKLGDGDHSIAEVTWAAKTQKPGRQQRRFAHTGQMSTEGASVDPVPRETTATWSCGMEFGA